jgi:hypothetical protein
MIMVHHARKEHYDMAASRAPLFSYWLIEAIVMRRSCELAKHLCKFHETCDNRSQS